MKKNFVTHCKVVYQNVDDLNFNEILIPTSSYDFQSGNHINAYFKNDIESKLGFKIKKIVSHKKFGICPFYDNYAELKRSHVIANTAFRQLLKRSKSGNFLKLSSGQQPIEKTNDSWACYMLSDDAESFFNRNYENYAINALRGKNESIKIHKFNDGFAMKGVNSKKLIFYFLSIYWRGSLSQHSAYSSFEIDTCISNYLKESFKNDTKINPKFFSIRIKKLHDYDGILKDENFKLITNPFIRKVGKFASYFLIFEGYVIEISLSSNYKQRQEKGWLSSEKDNLYIPYISIYSIPELVFNFINAVQFKNASTI